MQQLAMSGSARTLVLRTLTQNNILTVRESPHYKPRVSSECPAKNLRCRTRWTSLEIQCTHDPRVFSTMNYEVLYDGCPNQHYSRVVGRDDLGWGVINLQGHPLVCSNYGVWSFASSEWPVSGGLWHSLLYQLSTLHSLWQFHPFVALPPFCLVLSFSEFLIRESVDYVEIALTRIIYDT